MNLSQKCQYGLRAAFELAKRFGQGPVSAKEIADVQAIPPRFLEQILSQLKQAGYVESRRGVQGGYFLGRQPEKTTVGELIRFFEGPLTPVRCIAGSNGADCPLIGQCAFEDLWVRAQRAIEGVYDNTSLADLVNEHDAPGTSTTNYTI